MAIGGAEDRAGARRILRHFYTLAGGDDARLVVIPTASEDRQGAGQMHLDIFQSFGAATVEILPVFNRQDAIEPAHLAPLQAATGIFLVGGNQLRFSALLGGTPLAQAIRRANAAGVLIGGTSAGAMNTIAVLSSLRPADDRLADLFADLLALRAVPAVG